MSDLENALLHSRKQQKHIIAAKAIAEGIVRDAEAGTRSKDDTYLSAKAYLEDLQKPDRN